MTDESLDDSEFESPRQMFGKWAKPGVPRKGWECIDMEDAGGIEHICEMCERTEIRYIHHMQHPDYPKVLLCGCVCAGKMEQDYEAARGRERVMRSRARRRDRFINKDWKLTSRGHWRTNYDGRRFVIGKHRDGTYWLGVAKDDGLRFAKPRFSSIEKAKAFVFDAAEKRRTR